LATGALKMSMDKRFEEKMVFGQDVFGQDVFGQDV